MPRLAPLGWLTGWLTVLSRVFDTCWWVAEVFPKHVQSKTKKKNKHFNSYTTWTMALDLVEQLLSGNFDLSIWLTPCFICDVFPITLLSSIRKWGLSVFRAVQSFGISSLLQQTLVLAGLRGNFWFSDYYALGWAVLCSEEWIFTRERNGKTNEYPTIGARDFAAKYLVSIYSQRHNWGCIR